MDIIKDRIEELTALEYEGLITGEDQDVLKTLIDNSPEARHIWEAKRRELDQAAHIREGYDEEAMLSRVLERIDDNNNKRVKWLPIASAAAAVLVLGLGILFYLRPPKQKPYLEISRTGQAAGGIQLRLPNGKTLDLANTNGQVQVDNTTLKNTNKVLSYNANGKAPAGVATLTVPIGKDYKLQLSDGSEVWLNSATEVRFPFAFEDTREIYVNGEAYIKVSPDASRKFLVHLPGERTVMVLGTEFNVNSYEPEKVKISLVEGAVKVAAGKNTKTLQPGYEAVSGEGGAIQTGTFDPEYTLSWRKGIFFFDNVTLTDICKVLPRWFGQKAILDNPAIANQRFSGSLDRNRPLERQLELFRASRGVDFYFEDGALHFKAGSVQ